MVRAKDWRVREKNRGKIVQVNILENSGECQKTSGVNLYNISVLGVFVSYISGLLYERRVGM